MRKALIAMAMLTALTGCLEKDVTQTLYIERDGTVTWEVLERDVYSSSAKAEDRLREEGEYVRRATAGRPEIVEALTEIGGTDVRVDLLRDRRPFSLLASARFQDLEHALDGLFVAAEIDARVRLETVDERHTLTLVFHDLDPQIDDEDPVLDLLGSDDLRFVMTDGAFEEADGFTIEQDGRVAVWSGESDADGETLTRFRLVWTAG